VERNKYNELITGGGDYAGVPRTVWGEANVKMRVMPVWGWGGVKKVYVRESERRTIALTNRTSKAGAGDNSLKTKTNEITKGVTILSAGKLVFSHR